MRKSIVYYSPATQNFSYSWRTSAFEQIRWGQIYVRSSRMDYPHGSAWGYTIALDLSLGNTVKQPTAQIEQRVSELRWQLQVASYAHYVLDNPLMEDRVCDRLHIPEPVPSMYQSLYIDNDIRTTRFFKDSLAQLIARITNPVVKNLYNPEAKPL